MDLKRFERGVEGKGRFPENLYGELGGGDEMQSVRRIELQVVRLMPAVVGETCLSPFDQCDRTTAFCH